MQRRLGGDAMDARAAVKAKDRSAAIDALRFIAAGWIVILHTLPVDGGRAFWIGLADLTGRFAVPFFFVMAGVLMGRSSLPPTGRVAALTRRLLPVFLVWLALYLVITPDGRERLADPVRLAKALVTGGPGFHLWFLPALWFSAAAALAANRWIDLRLLWAASALLTLAALAAGPYAQLLGLGQPLNQDQLFAPLFVVTGLVIGREGMRPRRGPAFALALGGFFLQFTESLASAQLGLAPFGSQHVLIGTIPFGIGVALIALSIQPTGPSWRLCASLGVVSLGIYCSHLAFIWLLTRFRVPEDFASIVMVSGGSLAVAAGLSLLMSKVRLLRPLVS